MTPRLHFAGLLAAVVPGLALWFSAPAERAVAGLAVAPFGWPSLLVVQILAALPLAAGLAARSRGWFVNPGESIPAWIPAAVGLLLAALAYFQAPELGDALRESDFAVRAIVRTLLCVALAWPWFLIGSYAGAGRAIPLLLSLLVACALPAIHADALADKGIREGNDLLLQDRIAKARPVWEAVCDLAPRRAVPGFKIPITPPEVRTTLDAEIARLTKALAGGLPSNATVKTKLGYAGALLNLDRAVEAEEILRALPRDPATALRLGEAMQQQGKLEESDAVLRPALDPRDPALCRAVYEQLARNATERHDRAEVERLLIEATEKLPAFAGYFQLQLGRHYQQSGRPFDAAAAFDRAAALDPKLIAQIEPHRRTIREQTPGCLLGR